MSKAVLLNLPTGRQVSLTGSDRDRSIVGAIEYSKGYYEQNVMAAIKDTIKSDFVCLDVGANIGAVCLAIADMARNGQVIAIEAGKQNFQFLNHNIQANGFSNVEAVNVAVSDYKGTATFNYVEEVAGCSFISTRGIVAGAQEIVDVTTIDDLIESYAITRLDFVKMDVEGGERKALAGAIHAIDRFNPMLLIEWNPSTIRRFYGEDPLELFSAISANWSALQVLRTDERISVNSYEHLTDITAAGKGWEDLLCRP